MTTTAPPVAYRGSVKDVLGPVTVAGVDGASAIFRYADSYSVFDWGRMPDHLPRKGAALALLAADLFEKLEAGPSWKEFSKTPEAQALRRGIGVLHSESDAGGGRSPQPASVGAAFNELGERLQSTGLRTHYLGVHEAEEFPDSGPMRPLSLAQVTKPARYLVVRSVEVVRPQFKKILGRAVADYEACRMAPTPKLIPLEVVFRFGCPPGSSLLSRASRDPSLLSNLAVPRAVAESGLKAGMEFEFPILELFTKLEPSDRPVSPVEALAIAGISAAQLQELLLRTAWVAGFLRATSRRAGLELADGKLEWAISSTGELMLVDAIGPDELRILQGGLQLSKEFLRRYYRETPWYDLVEEAKKRAAAQGISDWKRLVTDPPPALPTAHKELATQLYLALTNSLTGKTWFPDAWSLERVTERLRALENNSGESAKFAKSIQGDAK